MTFSKNNYFTYLLALFAFLLPWQTRYIFGALSISGTPSEYGAMSLYATELLLIIGLVIGYVWLGRPTLRGENKAPAVRAGILIAAAFVSILFSSRMLLSFALCIHIFSAMVFFLALLDERVRLKRVIGGFALGLVPPLVVGACQVLMGSTPPSTILGLASRDANHAGDSVILLPDGTRMLRAYGSFPHPNIFGGYLAVGVVAAAWLWFKEQSLRRKPLLIALMAVLATGLFLTSSRSAILGLALGAGLSLVIVRMKNVMLSRILVIPLAVAVIGGALGLTLFVPRFAADTRGGGVTEMRSVEERASQYGEFMKLEKLSNPVDIIFGHGVGTYVFELADAFPGGDVYAYQPIHSLPLLVFFDIGIIGCVLVVVWQSTVDKMNFARFPHRDAIAAFAMGNVVLVILFFDHYIWSSWSGLALIAFVMALTVRMGESERI
jgi:hypothetical protein